MKMTRDLFVFRFTGPLRLRAKERLTEATGMRIGDTVTLWKDTPGKGRITPEVHIHLWRPTDAVDDWQIDATTTEAEFDREAVEACRQRLLALLPEITVSWEERPAGLAQTAEQPDIEIPEGDDK